MEYALLFIAKIHFQLSCFSGVCLLGWSKFCILRAKCIISGPYWGMTNFFFFMGRHDKLFFSGMSHDKLFFSRVGHDKLFPLVWCSICFFKKLPSSPLISNGASLTTGNSGQMKMSPKFCPLQKRRFGILPINIFHSQFTQIVKKKKKKKKKYRLGVVGKIGNN